MTAGHLLDFILENKKNKVFRGMSTEQVAGLLAECLGEEMVYYTEENGRVTGLILGHKIPEKKVIFVQENLAMTTVNLRLFAAKIRQAYPDWKLEAMRHDRHRKFDTEKLYKKLKI